MAIEDYEALFGSNAYSAHTRPREVTEAEQLEGLRERFAELKSQIPPLYELAEAQGITSIDRLEDVVPLLFPHNIYKSYPEEHLLEGRYDLLTKWLARLTLLDLSAIADQAYETMDDWMDAIDRDTQVQISHSSGTSGKLSFYPRGRYEAKRAIELARMRLNDPYSGLHVRHTASDSRFFSIIWPTYATGRTSILRGARILKQLLVERDEDFHPFLPTALSSDYHYYVMRCQRAAAMGQSETPKPSDYVYHRLQEAERLKTDAPKLQRKLFDTISDLKGKQRIVLFGTPVTIHQLATVGLKRGMTDSFTPGSRTVTVGGFKTSHENPNLVEDINRFVGDGTRNLDSYGMTELLSGFSMCEENRWHVPPWVVVFLIDPETGKLLPREGVQRGRAAFFDLAVRTYWAGIVTADYIEVDWTGVCECGRKTPHIKRAVTRLPEASDERYIGTSDKAAVDAAFESLVRFEAVADAVIH